MSCRCHPFHLNIRWFPREARLTVIGVATALACLPLLGCEPLWNAANRAGLESDVRDLLKKAKVVPQRLDCRMVGSTRDASCSLRLSQAEAAAVIQALALGRINSSSGALSSPAHPSAVAGPSCVVGASAPLAAFGSTDRRPNALRLDGGSAFEYLLLTYKQSTGQACLQLSHSYG